ATAQVVLNLETAICDLRQPITSQQIRIIFVSEMTGKRKKNPTEPFEEELQETEENEQEQIEYNAKPRRNRRRRAKQRKTEAGEVVVPKYLWVKYGESRSVPVATEGCNFAALFIDAVKAKMPNTLGSFDANQITLHTSEDAAALEPDHEVVKLASGPAGLSAKTPLIVKTIPAVAPVVQ
ncbi:hypothetical protein MP638_002711, partial [Amoeboaphelidium occidentale]